MMLKVVSSSSHPDLHKGRPVTLRSGKVGVVGAGWSCPVSYKTSVNTFFCLSPLSSRIPIDFQIVPKNSLYFLAVKCAPERSIWTDPNGPFPGSREKWGCSVRSGPHGLSAGHGDAVPGAGSVAAASPSPIPKPSLKHSWALLRRFCWRLGLKRHLKPSST